MNEAAVTSEIPIAHVSHRSSGRLRIRVPGKRGDEGYFSFLSAAFSGLKDFEELRANTITGSVLIEDPEVDEAAIAYFAEKNDLFLLREKKDSRLPVSVEIGNHMKELSAGIRGFSRGELDLPSVVFMVLVANGIYQIARGNIGAPPWYTAFWYALGIFTKSINENCAQFEDTAADI